MTDDHIAKIVSVYDTIALEYSKHIQELAPEPERQKFISKLAPKAKILDVGCAAGRDSLFFHQKGFDVIGVDLSEKLLAIAKQHAPHVAFEKQDIRSLSFPKEIFDGIWASAVLLHLQREEMVPTLKGFYKLLKPGGLLYLSLKWGHGEKMVSESLSQQIPRRFVFYQPEEVRMHVTKAGFIIDELSSWNSQDRHPKDRIIEWIYCFARKV